MNIAWVDLETSGSDETSGHVLEIGCVVTNPDLVALDEFYKVVNPGEGWQDDLSDFVRDMHDRSGLLDAVGSGVSLTEADESFAAFLDRYIVDGRIILAGSGVGHFDSRWIRAHLRLSAKRLTYFVYDVGVVRRFLRTVDEGLLRPAPDKAHRGLDDARDHLDEWKFYRDVLGEMLYLAKGPR